MKVIQHIILAVTLNCGLVLLLFSQDHDVQWILGDAPVSILDFRNDTIQSHWVSDTINIFEATANICDKEGHFLFFTNGIFVYDRYGHTMPNSHWLSYYNYNVYLAITSGAPNDQGVMILPKPGSDNLYYIFHFVPIDTGFTYAGQSYNEPTHFYYSLVDMNANFGLGDVIEKDVRLPLTGVNCASKMTAVKHANGRDWWIIRHGWRDNKYIKFLLTPDTILGPYFQNIGPPFNQNGRAVDFYGTSVFNSDGTKMASANYLSPIVVLDFDRCSGEFSNPLVINNKARDTTLLGAIGLSFSPGGRFLYANLLFELNQYDLQSPTPNDSIRIFSVDTTDAFWLHQHRLGPNGKIYIGTWNGGNYHLHVINDPDSLGLACNFQFQGQQCLTSNTYNLPNMVNYKLGPLIGSGCDTIVSGVPGIKGEGVSFRVSPNPASNLVDIVVKDSKEDMQLTIYNTLGQVIGMALVNNYVELDVSGFENGVYQLQFTSPAGKNYTTRLVVSK